MSERKSILHQLSKYGGSKAPQSQVQVTSQNPNYDFESVIQKLWPEVQQFYPHGIDAVKWRDEMLGRLMVPPKSELYPDMVYIRYHLFYQHQILTSEDNCDKEITAFARKQNPEEYKEQFLKQYSKVAQRITLLKALQATKRYASQIKYDKLDTEYHDIICNLLSVNKGISLKKIGAMQDSEIRQAPIDDKILGTIGYKIIWAMEQNNSKRVGSVIPLLEDSKLVK